MRPRTPFLLAIASRNSAVCLQRPPSLQLATALREARTGIPQKRAHWNGGRHPTPGHLSP